MKDKIIIIGIDGATFDIINPLIEKGYLPTIKKLIDKGIASIAKSTKPPLTPTAWATIASGLNPGEHGIFGFNMEYSVFEGKFPRLNKKFNGKRYIWDILGEMGLKGIVINYPFTYPPEKICGIMISGMGTPDNKTEYAYPKDIKKILNEKYNYNPWIDSYFFEKKEILLEREKKSINDIKNATKHLIDTKEWDYLITVFMSVDHIQHVFWKDNEISKEIIEAYVEVDKAIEEILSSINEEYSIFIISDHGFGPNHKRVSINRWLEQMGYLEYKKPQVLYKMGFFQENVKYLMLRLGLKKLVRKIPLRIKEKVPSKQKKTYDIDFEKTTAYSKDIYGQIYLKDKNKIKKLVKDLNSFENPINGDRIIKNIILKKELYHGTYLDYCPDIIIEPKDKTIDFVPSLKDNKLIDDSKTPGSHREDGIFIASGKRIKKKMIESVNLTDIVPFILKTRGITKEDLRIKGLDFVDNITNSKKQEIKSREKMKIQEKINKKFDKKL